MLPVFTGTMNVYFIFRCCSFRLKTFFSVFGSLIALFTVGRKNCRERTHKLSVEIAGKWQLAVKTIGLHAN